MRACVLARPPCGRCAERVATVSPVKKTKVGNSAASPKLISSPAAVDAWMPEGAREGLGRLQPLAMHGTPQTGHMWRTTAKGQSKTTAGVHVGAFRREQPPTCHKGPCHKLHTQGHSHSHSTHLPQRALPPASPAHPAGSRCAAAARSAPRHPSFCTCTPAHRVGSRQKMMVGVDVGEEERRRQPTFFLHAPAQKLSGGSDRRW